MDNQNFNQPMSSNPKHMPPIMPELEPKKKVWIISGILGIVLIIALAIYFILPKSSQETIKKTTKDIYKPAVASASKFATYKEVAVNISPKVPTYSVSQNLSNVTNANDFTFSDSAKDLLVKNAFVVKLSYYNEFFPLYELNRYSYTPSLLLPTQCFTITI